MKRTSPRSRVLLVLAALAVGGMTACERAPQRAPIASAQPLPTTSAPSSSPSPSPGLQPLPSSTAPASSNAVESDDENDRECTPITHPLAVALSRDVRRPYTAVACKSIVIGKVGGSALRVPGIIVRLDAPRFENVVEVDLRWKFLEKYASHLGIAGSARDALRFDGFDFIQRVPGTNVDVEGGIRLSSILETTPTEAVAFEIRFSLFDVSKYSNAQSLRSSQALWQSVKTPTMAAARDLNLVAPRLIKLPHALVTRAHGVVVDVDIRGVELGEGTKRADIFGLRIAENGKILHTHRTPVPGRRPSLDPPHIDQPWVTEDP